MKSEEERGAAKISYEKPTTVDLGPTAPIVGASCVPGEFIQFGDCKTTGNSARHECDGTGNSAGAQCTVGVFGAP